MTAARPAPPHSALPHNAPLTYGEQALAQAVLWLCLEVREDPATRRAMLGVIAETRRHALPRTGPAAGLAQAATLLWDARDLPPSARAMALWQARDAMRDFTAWRCGQALDRHRSDMERGAA